MKGRIPTIAAHPTKADELYAGVGGELKPDVGGELKPDVGGVYRSTDGGETFEWISQGMEQGNNFFVGSIWNLDPGIAVAEDGTMVAVGSWAGKGYRYDPISGQWGASIPFEGGPQGVYTSTLQPGRFYVVTGEGVYRSDDGGRTWEKTSDVQGANRLIVAPKVKDRLALSHAEGILISLDGAKTWKEIGRDLPHRAGAKPGCFAGNRLLILTSGAGVFWTDLKNHPTRDF